MKEVQPSGVDAAPDASGLLPASPRLRIAVVSNTTWNLANFRLNVMRKLRSEGHTVIGVAPPDRFVERLNSDGFEMEPIRMSAGGTNPFAELRSMLAIWRVLRLRDIDLVLSYTPKGNLYSAVAAIAAGREFIPNVSGLGRAFIRRSPITWVVELLYRLTFGRARHVFFQNMDDLRLFVRTNLVPAERAERLPGSGVDLDRFRPAPPVAERGADAPVFLLLSRMLWDKGVGEFIAAARIVKAVYPKAQFRLMGDLASGNPAAIALSQIQSWVDEGIVFYSDPTDDVRPHMASADCVVLPSYREGVPRVLLEAAAMARPVITTDAPGCRDAVLDKVSGFMCRARDARDLAQTLSAFVQMAPSERVRMGVSGREFVEARFSEHSVIDRYLHAVSSCAASPRHAGARPLPLPSAPARAAHRGVAAN